jgi:hypothetical protein
MAHAEKLRRRAELLRRAAGHPTEGGKKTDRLLITIAERLEREIEERAAPFAENGEIRPPRRCRVCGCTDERPCPGGCFWVAADLCSNCGASPTSAVRL